MGGDAAAGVAAEEGVEELDTCGRERRDEGGERVGYMETCVEEITRGIWEIGHIWPGGLSGGAEEAVMMNSGVMWIEGEWRMRKWRREEMKRKK